MGTMRRLPCAVLLTAALLAGCTSSPDSSPTPSASPTPTATVTSTVTASPSPSATPEPSPSATATGHPSDGCDPWGTTAASESSPDWASDLRTAPGDQLWGVTMRVGAHECYDRWVFEFDGNGAEPGWRVVPHDASTFPGDASGADFTPALTADASLEILFAAWYDGTPIDQPAYAGPMKLVTGRDEGIAEARIIGAFEGITQIGIGLDGPRAYEVRWLENPPRLVVDIAND